MLFTIIPRQQSDAAAVVTINALLSSPGMPAVVTLALYSPELTTDDVPAVTALKLLEDAGADVVGLNCARGPNTMLPTLREARKVCKVRTKTQTHTKTLIKHLQYTHNTHTHNTHS